MEYRYSVYGVGLTTDLLFDFAPCRPGDAPRVMFARGEDAVFDALPRASEQEAVVCRELDDQSLHVQSSSFYDFVVDRSGANVAYRPRHDGDPSVLRNFLFGQALSIALVRQGIEPLHAAVVDVGGGAVALLGDCTFGKSTLAASFVHGGYRLLTDDMLVVHERGGGLVAMPGTGRLKLMGDSAAAFFRGRDRGVPLTAHSSKRVFRLEDQMLQQSELPLRAFFVLPTPDERARSVGITVESLAPAELLTQLIANAFVTLLDDPARLDRNFSSNGRLAAAIPGYRLSYPAGLERLPLVGDAILGHLGFSSKEDLQ